MKAHIELSDSLDRTEDIDQIVILAYDDDKLLLLEDSGSTTLPRARFERDEAIEKTVRRELYEQTGALLRKSRLLGLLKIEHERTHHEVPIYVGVINHIESPVLRNAGRKCWCSSTDARKYLVQPEWEKTKEFLFQQAWKMKERM